MRDGSTYYGNIHEYPNQNVPFWLRPQEESPLGLFIFIRTARNQHFASSLIPLHLQPNHNPIQHGPTNILMRIENNQFYAANNFHVYPVEEHEHESTYKDIIPGDFPANNHIYLAVPYDNVYSSVLQDHV